MAGIHWTAAEWQLIAQYAVKKNKALILVPDPMQIITTAELGAAMKAVIRPSRHRPTLEKLKIQNKAQITAAIDYVRSNQNPQPVKVLDKPHSKAPIMWTPHEKQSLVAALIADGGGSRLENVSFARFREIMAQTIPEHRHRRFNAVTEALKILVPMLDDMPALPAPAKAAAPAFVPVVVETPAPAAKVEDVPGDGNQRKIFTTAAEWVLIAEEIHRQNRFFGWPYKEHLAGLSATEIADAFREALPPHRRKSKITPAICRPHLIEAFKSVRARIEAEALEKATPAQQEPEAPAVVPEPAPAPAAVPVAAPADALMLQVAHALAPLARLIGEALGKGFASALVPMLEDSMLNVLAAASPGAVGASPVPESWKPDAPDETDPLPEIERQPPSDYHGPEGVRHRNPRVAVIGPHSSLAHVLESTFPEIDFIYIEKGPRGIPEAVEGCDRIIGVDKFVNESTKIAIKRTDKGKAKFCAIHGGTSAVKRQIQLWISSGTLHIEQPQKNDSLPHFLMR